MRSLTKHYFTSSVTLLVLESVFSDFLQKWNCVRCEMKLMWSPFRLTNDHWYQIHPLLYLDIPTIISVHISRTYRIGPYHRHLFSSGLTLPYWFSELCICIGCTVNGSVESTWNIQPLFPGLDLLQEKSYLKNKGLAFCAYRSRSVGGMESFTAGRMTASAGWSHFSHAGLVLIS